MLKQIATCGVPLGSTLGSLLFLLYMNDMQSVISKSVVHQFADDTNFLFLGRKLGTTELANHKLKP